jgi:signal transduction histidine kinase
MEVHLLDREKLPRETVEMIESNLTQVDTLQELSNNLLTLAQYNNNTATKTKLEEVDVYQVIMDAFETVQPLAQKKNIKLTADLEQDLRVKGNAKSLVELSVILLDNAIKYSPENTEVIAAAEQEDHTIKISFKDEGIGIPKEDIPHIFDRFYRSNKSRTKSDVGGYGLGLSIAKKIVDMHKGTILVKSRQDNGTIFSIYLPAYTAK